MIKLSTGADSTLGNYLRLCNAMGGEKVWGVAIRFLEHKIASSPGGADEEVLVDEQQMIQLLFTMGEVGDTRAQQTDNEEPSA